MNRLAQEKSPYLRQHRDNPVDWYPWGNEAFEKAKQKDKPVLLSIGYSTCHWCHVMAHESFADADVAAVLNENFVCIKVDREERPDIDAVYMKVCQAITGAGGWPLTVFLTPEQKPFFAGTYFPKHSRYGQPGLVELSQEIAHLWRNDRDSLLRSCEEIAAAISVQHERNGEPRQELLQSACDTLRCSFDGKWGGFGEAPKFPAAHNLLFLMQCGETEMVNVTLTAMAKGGIFDQIGGGFSRYSTDNMWLTPHFEKMLYDNALLLMAYSEAYERTGNPFYEEIARRTAAYLLRELRAPEGGCFCGQDADSDGVEGGYYTFSPDEIRSVLGDAEGEAFCRDYGVNKEVSIPNRIGKDDALWSEARLQKLYHYRKARTKLHADDKILLSWNAWAMIAFVRSGHTDAAIRIRNFIEKNMTDADHRLFVCWRDGEAANGGQLDDYAVYALALLTLYRATFDVAYLEQAIFRSKQMLDCFADDAGGFFMTAHDAEHLIGRPKETYDGAIPSGNSVAAMVLETLAQLTGETVWREAADRQMRFMAGQAEAYPAGHCFALLAMDQALRPSRELIVCGTEVPAAITTRHGSDLNILFKSPENAVRLARCAPFTESYPVPEDGSVGYLCENGTCRRSNADLDELLD
ncbi:MAG: thioredoxin domain-containing protein [Clostridiales bacterium]|nr:thioredoxin domain-containing protein [Candidatus Cacconaster stercorequi]